MLFDHDNFIFRPDIGTHHHEGDTQDGDQGRNNSFHKFENFGVDTPL
jgi:hypothetical protein